MTKIVFILFFTIANCVSINEGRSELSIAATSVANLNCPDERGYHARFLQCKKDYYIKQLTARERYLKTIEANSKNQIRIQKLEELIEKKDYKRALSVSASILKNSNDEELKAEANRIARQAYQELQLREINKLYPESEFDLKE